jgi:hypothetical protein
LHVFRLVLHEGLAEGLEVQGDGVIRGRRDRRAQEIAELRAHRVGHRLTGTRDERADEGDPAQASAQSPCGAGDRDATPAVADQHDVGEVPALDLGDQVGHRVGQPQFTRVVAGREARHGQRDASVAGAGHPLGDRVPRPTAVPGPWHENVVHQRHS